LNPGQVDLLEKVNAHLVASLLGKASKNSAPGDDRISAAIVKVFWQWDKQQITQSVRVCIRLGHHPKLWKTAKRVVIPKPGKPDYANVRDYRVISLLDVISKLVERIAAHLIAGHLERKRGLHDGQFGCRKRQSCVDAVAVLMNHTQQSLFLGTGLGGGQKGSLQQAAERGLRTGTGLHRVQG